MSGTALQDLLRANTTLLQPGTRWFRVIDALQTLDIAGQVAVQISTINGQVTTLQSQVATLQSQMATANANIATLQSQVSTIQSQITALQNEDTNLQNQINVINTRLANAGIP